MALIHRRDLLEVVRRFLLERLFLNTLSRTRPTDAELVVSYYRFNMKYCGSYTAGRESANVLKGLNFAIIFYNFCLPTTDI